MPESSDIVAPLLTDPWFYAVAVPAVLIFGISKSGFGGALGGLSVPLVALVIAPAQAAAILLPIICLMDLLTLWAYRGKWVRAELRVLVPSALIGIAVGTLLFGYVSATILRLLLGTTALLFAVHYWMHLRASARTATRDLPQPAGVVASAVAGFTSFIAHAGGPPLSMYLLRRSLDKTQFVATTAAFFAAINYVKLVPYAWLGQLDLGNLKTSLVLAPLAPLGIAMGIWLHKKIPDRQFFRIACLLLFAISLKLISDGIRAF